MQTIDYVAYLFDVLLFRGVRHTNVPGPVLLYLLEPISEGHHSSNVSTHTRNIKETLIHEILHLKQTASLQFILAFSVPR